LLQRKDAKGSAYIICMTYVAQTLSRQKLDHA